MNYLSKIKFLGIFGTIRIIIDIIKTKIFFYNLNCKLIRFPFEIYGIKNISIKKGLSTGRYCKIESYNNENNISIYIGENCHLNDSVHIAALNSIIIGNNVLIASRVFITDLNHGDYSIHSECDPESIVSERKLSYKPVKIGNNVWIGESVAILPGVNLGDNCIVGANSVVTKSFEKNSIIAGNPAKLIRYY